MVKFYLNLLGFAPLLATLAVAGSIQVNYFYDNNCTDFASSPPVVPNDEVYVWEITGTNSAGIANCDGFDYCWCHFYGGTNDTISNNTSHGLGQLAQYPLGPTCVSGAFESFECTTKVN
jgi:hypothetical protein